MDQLLQLIDEHAGYIAIGGVLLIYAIMGYVSWRSPDLGLGKTCEQMVELDAAEAGNE